MSHHQRRHGESPHREQTGHQSDGSWAGRAINRVIRGCKDATGLGKGPVITLFVLGFIFMPLLTGLVFLAMLLWTGNPTKARESLDRFSGHVKRAGKHFTNATLGQPHRSRAAAQPDMDFEDSKSESGSARHNRGPKPGAANNATRTSPSDLRKRYESLEERARRIEAFVASEEYRLEQEFEKMNKS